MKKDLGVQQAVFPMPVLMIAAYDENGKVNVMNAAWGQIAASDTIALFISEAHKTTKNIRKTKAFTVSIADVDHMDVADYFGMASGNSVEDKFERTKYHVVKSTHVNAPIIEEFPVCMECELEDIVEGSIHAVVGKIINVCADASVLDEKGQVDVGKIHALMFDNFQRGYYEVGKKVGQAWDAGKKWL